MPETVIFPHWRDQQEPSKYPFTDSATLTADSGLVLGEDLFLDASLYPVGGQHRMYISTVVVGTDMVTINIGDAVDTARASVAFNPLTAPDLLKLEDSLGRAAGVLVSETLRLARFQGWDVGTHSFLQSASEFVASVCVPTPEVGVRALLTEDNDLLTNDVWIIGENGVVIRRDNTGVPAGSTGIRVDIVGDPLFRRRLCGDVTTTGPNPQSLFDSKSFLKTINGVPPDEFGDFHLTVGSHETSDPILRIVVTGSGLVVEAVGKETGL
jgi:hypothetical protein